MLPKQLVAKYTSAFSRKSFTWFCGGRWNSYKQKEEKTQIHKYKGKQTKRNRERKCVCLFVCLCMCVCSPLTIWKCWSQFMRCYLTASVFVHSAIYRENEKTTTYKSQFSVTNKLILTTPAHKAIINAMDHHKTTTDIKLHSILLSKSQSICYQNCFPREQQAVCYSVTPQILTWH